MNYTLDDLIELIARHDEHEDYYRAQLQELLDEQKADAWDEGIEFFEAAIYGEATSAKEYNPYRKEEA